MGVSAGAYWHLLFCRQSCFSFVLSVGLKDSSAFPVPSSISISISRIQVSFV